MKFSLGIPQFTLSKLAPKLSLRHAVILELLILEAGIQGTKKLKSGNKVFTQTNYSFIRDSLPIIDLKNDSQVKKLLNELASEDLIELKSKKNKVYFLVKKKARKIYLLKKGFSLKQIVYEEKSPASVKKKKKDPRVKEVIKMYKDMCHTTKGFIPNINWGADGKMVKIRLKEYTVDELQSLFYWYLNSDYSDEWGQNLRTALSNGALNRWRSETGQT